MDYAESSGNMVFRWMALPFPGCMLPRDHGRFRPWPRPRRNTYMDSIYYYVCTIVSTTMYVP